MCVFQSQTLPVIICLFLVVECHSTALKACSKQSPRGCRHLGIVEDRETRVETETKRWRCDTSKDRPRNTSRNIASMR